MWMQTTLCTSERTGAEQMGTLYRADIREVAATLGEQYAQKVDMVYLDPPAFTRKMAFARTYMGIEGYGGDAAFMQKMQQPMNRFVGTGEAYLAFVEQAVTLSRTLLTQTGCLYVHAPSNMAAEIKLICDRVFGKQNCMNEIIWHYGGGGRAQKGYARRHDTIYLYRKATKSYFNAEAIGIPRGTEKRNNLKRNVDVDGRVYFSTRVGGKEYRYYEDALVPPSDVWTDISDLQHKDPERCGYDTQKPEALMARLLAASCPAGGLAADLFCGSGALAVTAARQGKHFLAVDISDWAIWLTRKRLDEQHVGYVYQQSHPLQEDIPAAFRLQQDQAGYQIEICGFGQEHSTLPAIQHAEPQQISWEQVWLQQAPVQGVWTEQVEWDTRWLDGIAVGYLENPEQLRIVRQAARTVRHAELPLQFFLPYEQGTPCIRLTDAQGKHGYFIWEHGER